MKKILMMLLVAASVQASSLRVLLVDGTGPTTGIGHSVLDELGWVQSGHTGTPQRVSVFNSGGFADEAALGSNLEWSGTTIRVVDSPVFSGDVVAGGASLTNIGERVTGVETGKVDKTDYTADWTNLTAQIVSKQPAGDYLEEDSIFTKTFQPFFHSGANVGYRNQDWHGMTFTVDEPVTYESFRLNASSDGRVRVYLFRFNAEFTYQENQTNFTGQNPLSGTDLLGTNYWINVVAGDNVHDFNQNLIAGHYWIGIRNMQKLDGANYINYPSSEGLLRTLNITEGLPQTGVEGVRLRDARNGASNYDYFKQPSAGGHHFYWFYDSVFVKTNQTFNLSEKDPAFSNWLEREWVNHTGWQNPPNATNFTWTTNNNEITLASWLGTGGNDVVIPDYIDGLPVTAIGEQAFSPDSEGSAVTSVSGGANVTSIGDGAFLSCTSLASISLTSATIIGAQAFNSCISLTSISLPAATSIGTFAFFNCANLTSVTFGQNAPDEGANVYLNTPNVTNYVTNPTATGWGTEWNGRPVVRLGVTADSITLGGVTNTAWPTAQNAFKPIVISDEVSGIWTIDLTLGGTLEYTQTGNITDIEFTADQTKVTYTEVILLTSGDSINWESSGASWEPNIPTASSGDEWQSVIFRAHRGVIQAVYTGTYNNN